MKIKRRCIILGTIFIGILFSSLVVSRYGNFHRKELKETLLTVAQDAAVEVQTDDKMADILEEILYESVINLTGYCAFSLNENQYSQIVMQELYGQVKSVGNVYYMHASCNDETQTANGTFLAAAGEPGCKLSEEEIYSLCREGWVESDGLIATAENVDGDYYAVIVWAMDNIASFETLPDTVAAEHGETIFYLEDEGQGLSIYASSNGEYVGYSIEDVFGKSVDIAALCENDGTVETRLADGTRCIVAAVQAVEDKYALVFMPETSLRLNMARSILLPNLLFWTILILMSNFILKVMIDNDKTGDEGAEYLKVGSKFCIDGEIRSHIGASVVFGMVLMILLVLYSQTLINYSNQNMRAMGNLNSLEGVKKSNEENSEVLAQVYEYCNAMITEAIATYYMDHPEQLSDSHLSRLVDKMPYCSEITMYDNKGTSEYTTGIFKGYTIGHDESQEEYKCWDLIEGTRNVVSYYADEENYYVAGRRQDKDGIVSILIYAQPYVEFNRLMQVDSTVIRAGFNKANKIYTFADDSSKLYICEPGSEVLISIANTLPDEALENGYAGINRIEGVRYYINTIVYNNYIFISAEKLNNIRGLGLGYIIRILIFCFVLTYILLMAVSLQKVSHMEDNKTISRKEYETAHSIEEQMMDGRFRQMLRNMVILSGVLLVTLLGVDAVSSESSLLSYLFSSEWSYGINMFSVTMIIIMAVMGIVISIVTRTLILYVTKNMGPRGLTIGRMISSIVKLAVLIFVVARTLMYIGVNPSTLLAGAGIAGAMISFCAQQTVNDLLSGFFIVFEGSFNIGDWIRVDDFRGQVIEIGVRTTKVAIGDNIRVINNSELKKITIMARNSTGAICDVDVAYEEDVTQVIKLLQNNAEAFRKAIPEIVEGPFVDGVVELGASSVTIRMWALATQEDVLKVERQMRRVAKQVFEENNVVMPFPQLTLHTADD